MAAQKIALVTGAGSGVGRSAALALSREGYAVALAGRRADKLEAVAKEANGTTLVVPTDVREPAAILALFAKVKETFGRLDLLFNNAGVSMRGMPLEDIPLERWLSDRRHQSHRAIYLHPGSHQDHESAGSARRPHHQQRLDLGACAAARHRRLHRDQTRDHRAHQTDRRSTAAPTTSAAARSTSVMLRPRSPKRWPRACCRPTAAPGRKRA